MLPGIGRAQPRRIGLIQEIEGTEYPVRNQLLVGGDQYLDAVAVGGGAADVVDQAPLRLYADGKPDRRLLALEQSISQIERQALERRLTTVVEAGHTRNIEIGDARAARNSHVPYRRILGFQRLRERAVGTFALSEAAARLALEFLLSDVADVRADGESN